MISQRLRFALCNEVLGGMDFEAQCAYAAAVGYDGLELAPYTVSAAPHRLPAAGRARLRRAAAGAGLAITGLHWLLVTPPGLSITSPDAAVRARTVDVMRGLVELCADLGGRYLVHGSPAQRAVGEGEDVTAALGRARECWAAAGEVAGAAGVVYCIEPLSRTATRVVNTVEEAVAVVREIGHPALRAMLDTSAAATTEPEPVADVLERWLPKGVLGHVQVNDRNRRGPGQGDDRFAPVLAALLRHRYDGDVGVEPFDYHPDGRAAAARAIGYLRGLLEALQP
ncbi:MAG: sugar phosphate isomerase/epimerase family protein [Candidatus Rokuibacteriota bacterium]